MAVLKKWRGKEVTAAVAKNVAKALGKFGLVAEGFAKKELRKGHGVLTGTLRRSIHTAQPGYHWSGDDVAPSKRKTRKGVVIQAGSPERGSQMVEAVVDGKRITIQLGSGLNYALPVHQGHHSFEGYHYLTIGVDKAKPALKRILKEYQLR